MFGGRNWTTISAALLLIPCLLLAWAVSHPGIPFGVLVAIAATAGFGGGNFASSMANISFFYPETDKGWALGSMRPAATSAWRWCRRSSRPS